SSDSNSDGCCRHILRPAAQRVVLQSEAREDNVRRAVVAYLAALAALVVAVLLRWLLNPWLSADVPFITMFGAVAVAAWLGGYQPAIVAAVLGYLACAYFFIAPRGRFAITHPQDVIGLLLYLLTCGIIIVLAEAMRRNRGRANEDRERLRVTFASIGDAVITTDAEGRVTLLNPVAEQMTGWR